jgi:TPR repeat protein
MLIVLFGAVFFIILDSIVVSASNNDVITEEDHRRFRGTMKVQLDEDLFHRALAHSAANMMTNTEEESIVERLRRLDVEALYDVASSMNSHGDKLSSILIWHALADDGSEAYDYYEYEESDGGYDYTGHVPSSMALGFSYYDVDKPRSLRYFLMATSSKGRPHQAAMFNAGRLYLELDDPSSALAYIRSCASLDKTHPKYARPQLGLTCKKAYKDISKELITVLTSGSADPGLQEAVECFVYADMNDFPQSDTTEFRLFHEAMRELEAYAAIVRVHGSSSSKSNLGGDRKRRIENADAARTKGVKHLTSAFEKLIDFQSQHRKAMSDLQLSLLVYILSTIKNLIHRLETEFGSDEL